jgi:hypothetical protein
MCQILLMLGFCVVCQVVWLAMSVLLSHWVGLHFMPTFYANNSSHASMHIFILPSENMSPFLSMTMTSSQCVPHKQQPRPTKPACLTNSSTISHLADTPCCSTNCLSQLFMEQITVLHECYAACNEFEQSVMIITTWVPPPLTRCSQKGDSVSFSLTPNFSVQIGEVCSPHICTQAAKNTKTAAK